MSASWKLTARAPRPEVEAALTAQGAIEDWEPDFIVGACEVAEAPADWLLEAWLPRRPTRLDTMRLSRLFVGRAPDIQMERLREIDWVGASQQSAPPVSAGPFRVRTPDFPAAGPVAGEPGLIEFEIPAAQAFGTGQHDTTAGCLEMLARIKAVGIRPGTIADIGTGTGLLAFAALALWPRSLVTAIDNDPLCAAAVLDNASRNAITPGDRRGQVAVGVEEGTAGELIEARAPFDLIIANILAGPLIDLAPDFAQVAAPRASLVLAGLLQTQERALRLAYARNGFRLVKRQVRGDWSILWLRARYRD